jgi:hypothetical protein
MEIPNGDLTEEDVRAGARRAANAKARDDVEKIIKGISVPSVPDPEWQKLPGAQSRLGEILIEEFAKAKKPILEIFYSDGRWGYRDGNGDLISDRSNIITLQSAIESATRLMATYDKAGLVVWRDRGGVVQGNRYVRPSHKTYQQIMEEFNARGSFSL